MIKELKTKKYEAVSLIEMILTIVILTAVMLVTAVTMNTLIKTSAITNARVTSRQESEFVLELIRRNVRNSNSSDIYLYSTQGRFFSESTGKTADDVAVDGYASPVTEGQIANEIHFRPAGYARWICIAYFPTTTDDTKGYVVKSSYPDNENPENCFKSTDSQYLQNAVVLNSSSVYATLFELTHFVNSDGNILVSMSIQMESKYRMSFSKSVRPVFYKQTLVSTQKLTWE